MSDGLHYEGNLKTESASSPQREITTSTELPLEWTKLNDPNDSSRSDAIRFPSDVYDYAYLKDIDNTETYLEIVGTHGQKITHMGKNFFSTCHPNMTHIVLRSHVISKMEGIKEFRKLELLELYDNQIEFLDELGDGGFFKDESDEKMTIQKNSLGFSLKTLDISYNVIRDMKPVKFCTNLVELYIANNKIKTLAGLKFLKNLRKLDLGANRIRKMEGSELSGLVHLEELWLGKNKIEMIEGLCNLQNLRRLDVQSNRLTSIQNLHAQVNTLEELYLAHNGIDDEGAMYASGLGQDFTALKTLDLSKNRLTSCGPFSHLISLINLWVSSNSISTFDDVEPISTLGTRKHACLTEIYMEHNPVYKDFEYRKKLKEMIPSLVQIDANVIDATGVGSALVQTMSLELYLDQMRILQEHVVKKAKDQEKERVVG